MGRQQPPTCTRVPRRVRVEVGGCCLPIPLTLVTGAVVGARLMLRR